MSHLAAEGAEGVILLHGLCRTTSSMEKMAAALEKEGFVVVNQGYPSRTASIEQLSELVIGKALQNPVLAECSTIHFVTHSLGGILVRCYCKQHELNRLGRVVMLGPPNGGSEVTDKIGHWKLYRKLNGAAGDELGTGSDSTVNQLGRVDFECGIIAGDRSINQINSRMIKGKDDGKVSVENTKVEGMKDHVTIHATHPYLMKNKRAIEQTIAFLKHGSFIDD
jgi:triacylglycerol esterase/lipase EstA (alpha/beta hydrolase family)